MTRCHLPAWPPYIVANRVNLRAACEEDAKLKQQFFLKPRVWSSELQ